MDPQDKTYNLLTAATSLKSYEFDFGIPGAGAASKGAGGGSLKQQKLGGSGPAVGGQTLGGTKQSSNQPPPLFSTPVATGPALAPGFKPMASPWEVAAERMKQSGTETVLLSPTVKVQASFKEKAPIPGVKAPGMGAAAGPPPMGSTGGTPSWMPSGQASAGPTAGTPSWMASTVKSAEGGKPDALSDLWSSVATPSSSSSSSSSSSGGGVVSTARQRSASAAPSPTSNFFDASPAAARTSLASMKRDSPATGVKIGGGIGGGGIGGAGGAVSNGVPSKPSSSAFDFSGVSSAIPSAPAVSVTPSPAGGDPFAAFSSSASPAPGDPFATFSVPGASAAQPSASSGDPFSAFGPTSATPSPPVYQPASDPFDSLFGSAAVASPSTVAGAPLDPLEALLMKPKAQATTPLPAAASGAVGGADDWGVFGADAAGGEAAGGTVELEGLPPPPAGLSAAAALEKGEEFYKGGQFGDAIKWLMWAEALCGADASKKEVLMTVLTKRASAYKEAGEMKKAVADCSKVLELNPGNSTILMQRAILYEGLEKYGKGVEDLREVVKLDPSNMAAMTLLNRLSKLSD